MRRFRCAALAVVAVVGFASVACAADMPMKAAPMVAPVAAYNWTGFYVGGNAGYASGKFDPSSTFSCPTAPCTYNLPADIAAVNAAFGNSQNANGFTGGVQAGYNWRASSAVFGVEADFNALSLKSSQTSPLIPFPVAASAFRVSSSASTDWLFTLRGRAGLLVTPSVLLYGTGGLAVSQLKVSNTFTDNFAPVSFGASSASKTLAGWTIGAGAEWMMASHWSVKAEYLYVDFGSTTTTLTNNAPFIGIGLHANQMTSSADIKAQIGRLGVNYHF